MKVYLGPYPETSTKDRKINVRIDNYDTWSMDNTLAHIVLPMLIQLKKTKHGAPNTDDVDVPKKLQSTSAPPKKNEYDTDKFFFKRWDWILDEMVWAFEQCNKDWEKKFHSGKIDMRWQALDKDNKPIGKPQKLHNKKKHKGVLWYRTVKGPNDTHKFDMKGYQKHLDRMQNGFRLFGKYYMSLWD
jgi:hypothetical protein